MRFLRSILFVLGVLILLAGGIGGAFLSRELTAPLRPDAKPEELEVARGWTGTRVARELERRQILRYGWTLKILSRLSWDRGAIQAGVFELSASMSPVELFQRLRHGKTVLRPYTVPEGLTMHQVARLLAKEGLGGEDEFLGLFQDPQLARNLGVPQKNLEGYLLPETYHFPDGVSARKVVETMVQQHLKSLPPDYREQEKKLGLTHHQLVTLASLVEAETPLDEEKPLVAEVFYTRHKLKRRLQCDPTTVYGIRGFKPPILKRHLKLDHPYNTYIYPGLPPGPIGNPGEQALLASLAPAHEKNFYFVAKGDGSRGHTFSKTLKQHNRAARLYRKRLREARQRARTR